MPTSLPSAKTHRQALGESRPIPEAKIGSSPDSPRSSYALSRGMNFYGSPAIAMTIVRQHQADVRAAFPRRLPCPFSFPRPKPAYGGVTAVPELPDVAVPLPIAPQHESQPDTTAA
jgi:hypothetical protein